MTRHAQETDAGCLPPAARDVLHLLGRGATTAQIAEALRLSPAEVDALLALLQARFGAADRRSLRVRVILMQARE